MLSINTLNKLFLGAILKFANTVTYNLIKNLLKYTFFNALIRLFHAISVFSQSFLVNYNNIRTVSVLPASKNVTYVLKNLSLSIILNIYQCVRNSLI